MPSRLKSTEVVNEWVIHVLLVTGAERAYEHRPLRHLPGGPRRCGRFTRWPAISGLLPWEPGRRRPAAITARVGPEAARRAHSSICE